LLNFNLIDIGRTISEICWHNTWASAQMPQMLFGWRVPCECATFKLDEGNLNKKKFGPNSEI